ncbi:mannose-1-phosphate guanylyltransferase/mannose-6-phosphate isomerase [Sulfurimonas sp. HSL-1716]|uniref:mannose-1-phosphate guanylyltransferase/mannose-6-phosphate isomerase n=1 Tax=Hydrocurvibacter sulfurireducens TaxID=3131937 RepID=UPI0031F9E12D
MTNIILCGGSGTRLWPVSRTLMPKQFVKLFNDRSLFQLTVERNSKVCSGQFIVSNAEQYFLALDQLEELNRTGSSYLLEPVGRNTAPAIALACLAFDEEEILLITPSDHLIKNQEEYEKVLKRAKELAQENFLVTFGIKPTFAETGFGYIEADDEDVKAFHEKPDLDTAERYIQKGNHYWNSGIFCFKAGVFLEELKKYSPDIYESSREAYANSKKNELIRVAYEDMIKIPENSIDYAVMEKSDKVKIIPSDISWSDVGSFDSLSCELQNDASNNFIISNKNVETIDIQDCIIVDTSDALLVCKKGSSQKVKDIVARLKKEKSELPNIHLTGHRPWGTYTVLEDSSGYKIKRIEVREGKRLSLQKHYHRNEHWVVLSGTATVTIEDKTFTVNPNESTYIKAGDIHRLENKGKTPLVIIEVQVGRYTGEDDIVRLDDDFTRQ